MSGIMIRNPAIPTEIQTSFWSLHPQFTFADQQKYGYYLYEPYQAALGMEERTELEVSDMGYWSEPW